MISVNIISDNTLIFKVIKNLNKVDFERISLYIESLIDYNDQSTIQFIILSNHKNKLKNKITKYFNKLPYNYKIN